MGKPTVANPQYSDFTSETVPAEVKHFSKRRKRYKRFLLEITYSLSSGERRGRSPNHFVLAQNGVVGHDITYEELRRTTLERAAKEGKSPVF